MSYMKQAANTVLPFGLLGNALLKNRNKDKEIKPQPSLVTEGTQVDRSSMIGSGRY